MKRVVKSNGRGARQVHMNKVKFNPNKYKMEKEQLPKEIIATMTSLCCRRCCDIIQWKVDYGKFVTMDAAKKCNICSQKNVMLTYHRICQGCASEQARCAKCQKMPMMLARVLENSKESDEEDEEQDSGEENANDPSAANKFSFVDNEPEEEEFKYLRGLDIRVLQRDRSRRLREEQQEHLGRLRERERRTALRKVGNNAAEFEDEGDDDEVL